MKLVIITHPDLKASIVNKMWIQELKKHPSHFHIHELYKVYPNLDFDINVEQKLLSKYNEIIFQFPIHWYSTPFALKKYIDEVFTYGWAFGPEGNRLKEKKISFAVSTGGLEESYEAKDSITVSNLLNDFKLSFQYCGCEFKHLHIFYGAMYSPSTTFISSNAKKYVATFLD